MQVRGMIDRSAAESLVVELATGLAKEAYRSFGKLRDANHILWQER